MGEQKSFISSVVEIFYFNTYFINHYLYSFLVHKNYQYIASSHNALYKAKLTD
jgi:hypothetical protein